MEMEQHKKSRRLLLERIKSPSMTGLNFDGWTDPRNNSHRHAAATGVMRIRQRTPQLETS